MRPGKAADWLFMECPEAVDLLRLSLVTADVYDIAHFPELKEKYNVMSVPCLVINQDKVTFGKKNIQQLLEVIGTGNSNEI